MSKESKNQMKIRYNPYLKTIQYYWWLSRVGAWEPLAEESRLAKSKYQQGTLQHQAAEILEIIREDYCQSAGLELVFEGTESDWEDIKRIAGQYDPDHKLHLCERVTCGLTPAPVVLKKIETIFTRLSASFDSHREDDARAREVLENYTRTMRPEIPICVMGTFSAGKSTFINALIGEEILPSAANPTTARVFRIIPLPGGDYIKTRVRFQYGGSNVEITFHKKGYAFQTRNNLPDSKLKKHLDEALTGKTVSPAYIYQTIEALNRFKPKPENAPDLSDLIEVEIPFSHSTLPLDRFQFVIYDTPGSNSNTHRDHAEILKAALKEQTDGLPLILTTSTGMDSNDAQELMDLIRELGGALDDSSKLAIVCKADKLASSDIEALKDDPSVITKKIPARIFFLSSILGLGAKKEDMEKCVYDNDRKVFRSEREDCINGQTKLYQHNTLTKERFDAICAAGGKANRGTDDRAKLLHNSGLWAVENEIAVFAEKYAVYNKCRQAKDYLQRAIGFVECAAWQKREEQKNRVEEVSRLLTAKEQALLAKLQNAGEQELKKAFTGYVELTQSICRPARHVSWQEVERNWTGVKRKQKYPIAAMQAWVDNTIHAAWDLWWQTARERTEDFWAKQVASYRQACIQIVNEDDVLTGEEKEFLEQFILACPGLASPKISLDVQPLLEEKVFLFFWRWKEFNTGKCVTVVNNAIDAAVMDSTHTYAGAVEKEVKRWTANFKSGLTEKLADFNPGLRRLTGDLRRCRARLEQLEANQKLLEDSAQEIKDLFKFDDEREKQ